MGLNRGRIPRDSHWRILGRRRGYGQEPGGTFQACPVGDDSSLEVDLDILPIIRSLPGDDSFALECLFVSAERFITLFHTENRAGPPDQRLRQVRREIESTGTYRHTAGRAGIRRARRLAEQRQVHRAAVLAQPAGARPA